MLNSLMRVFGGNRDGEEEEFFDDGPSFVVTEHMRIVLAIAVAMGAACFMWWIVA